MSNFGMRGGGARGAGGGSPMGGPGQPRGAVGIAGAPPKASGPKGSSNVIAVSERDFESEVLRCETPVFIEFLSERSSQCKSIAPEVEAFANEMVGKLKVVVVDIDKSPTIARQLRVQSVPTFMVFADGRIADGVAGAIRKKQMRDMVDPFLPRAEGALKPVEMAELLREGAVVPVDTRDPSAFGRARIPGAKNMPLDEIEGRLAELHMFGQPVLYCRGGDKTKELAAKLAEQGVPVAFLEGGFLSWEADGLTVEK